MTGLVSTMLLEWIDSARNEPEREFRKVAHIILVAVARSDRLQQRMVMKGGTLISLKYGGGRYTRDLDFSTDLHYKKFDDKAFVAQLNESLLSATETLAYGLDCRVQSFKAKPSRPDASFPTLTVKIGYALKGTRQHRWLLEGHSSKTVKIDYSFNETTVTVDRVPVGEGLEILAYSICDLVAEKYRALLQQKPRDRIRRQDAYDLCGLIRRWGLDSDDDRAGILKSLKLKASSRDLTITASSVRDNDVVERSREDYNLLDDEVDGQLEPFDTVYDTIADYYQSLPWG